ncbi:MAG: hypothetical protein JKY50_16270 [Oleispira sp.]|nr:hypothetical protein [Oleispira sp.]MBL4882682.1 hypothetical protein [Oleispira sp.]
MKVYLITFYSITNTVSRESIQKYFDIRPEILNWFGVMPQAILVATECSDSIVSSLLVEHFGQGIIFLITSADQYKTQGYINKEVWEFINNPKPSKHNGLLGLLGQGYNK